MRGRITLAGIQCDDKFYTWNSRYNIGGTMLFIHNNWARLDITPYVGMLCDFLIIDGSIDDAALLNDDGSLLSKEQQKEIENNYKNKL